MEKTQQQKFNNFGKPAAQAKKPEQKFSAGAISATIWRNETQATEGDFSTITLSRSYKDKSGAWQHTSSFRINDLPKAALVLNKAYDYLTTHKQELDA